MNIKSCSAMCIALLCLLISACGGGATSIATSKPADAHEYTATAPANNPVESNPNTSTITSGYSPDTKFTPKSGKKKKTEKDLRVRKGAKV